jgi:hypothetical protein
LTLTLLLGEFAAPVALATLAVGSSEAETVDATPVADAAPMTGETLDVVLPAAPEAVPAFALGAREAAAADAEPVELAELMRAAMSTPVL